MLYIHEKTWSYHGASLTVQENLVFLFVFFLLCRLVFYDNESAKCWKCKENKFIK